MIARSCGATNVTLPFSLYTAHVANAIDSCRWVILRAYSLLTQCLTGNSREANGLENKTFFRNKANGV